MRLLVALLLLLVSAPASAQTGSAPNAAESPIGIHLGVATCAGSNCHGATQRPRGSYVPGNEYLIWSKQDKHRNAYNVLLEDRAIKMARVLGLPDAANQKLCLDCHADNASADRRGVQFQLSDGVGCEACHGGASRWLGVHISGANHQQNIAAGLYPTEQPIARAEKCLGCHYGDETRFADHRLYGAGHPRLAFELDTYTAIEPAHFVVDQSYVERKGRITDAQVWAVGQAIALVKRMDAVLDPKHAPKGFWPEFSFFDCQSCHHEYGAYAKPTTTGLGPGTVKFNDANEVMLKVAATRIAPGAASALSEHMLALHKATQDDWAGVQREAAAVRRAAQSLVGQFAHHD
ncbi:MAG TPA: multiheme c-type cytochrome, partial [Stellaceae bacterium]|nr:multiheme c-type cytochrome [Stellaceae bacterium]